MKLFAGILTLGLLAPDILMAADQPSPGLGLRAWGVTFVFLVILGVAAWLLKTYGPQARVRKSTGLDVVGQMPLNAKAGLALVRAGKTILLLGVTQNQVSLIKDLGENPFEKTMEQQLDTKRGSFFS